MRLQRSGSNAVFNGESDGAIFNYRSQQHFRVVDVHLALCMTAPSTTPGPTPCRDGDVCWRRVAPMVRSPPVPNPTLTGAELVGTFSRETLGAIKIRRYCGTPHITVSATIPSDINSSQRLSRKGTHKCLPIDSRGDRSDRRGAMAAVEANPGR